MNLKGAVPLIEPVSRKLLREELTTDRLVRHTRIGSNEVYIFTARKAPNLMQEVGRLRELTFRDAGAGFGTAVDVGFGAAVAAAVVAVGSGALVAGTVVAGTAVAVATGLDVAGALVAAAGCGAGSEPPPQAARTTTDNPIAIM